MHPLRSGLRGITVYTPVCHYSTPVHGIVCRTPCYLYSVLLLTQVNTHTLKSLCIHCPDSHAKV